MENEYEEIFEQCDFCKVFLDISQARVTLEGDMSCDECLVIQQSTEFCKLNEVGAAPTLGSICDLVKVTGCGALV